MCSTLKMCSYGGFFNGQKSNINNITTVNSILPGELAEALQTNSKIRNNTLNDTHIDKQSVQNEDVMLLDCRSFLAYNFKHISGALNVNCTGIVKKRLQQGKATLVDLVTSEYGKEFLKSGRWVKAVVYDDCTTELEKVPPSHPLKIVLVLLHKQGKEAFLLKGRFTIRCNLFSLNNVHAYTQASVYLKGSKLFLHFTNNRETLFTYKNFLFCPNMQVYIKYTSNNCTKIILPFSIPS